MNIELLCRGLVCHFEYFTFSAGEPHIKLHKDTIFNLNKEKTCLITGSIHNTSSLIYLYCLVDAIRRSTSKDIEIKFLCDYFPGSRQDRVCVPGEPLTVKIYADLINNLNFSQVEICDPHSDVTPALINNCILYPIYTVINKVIQDCQPDYIISPDAGASKRIYQYLNKMKYDIPVIQCLKQRDVTTGKLTRFEICSDEFFTNKKLLILDDICENGGTFIGLASLPKFQLAQNLYLYVTHGIFPKGQETIDNLHKYFTTVYCTNSFKHDNIICNEKFKVFVL